jgi:hypothetical protein
VTTHVSCSTSGSLDQSTSAAACVGCSMFSDSMNLLHGVDEISLPWCVHLLSVIQAYEAVLHTLDTLDCPDEQASRNLTAFQSFILKHYMKTSPCTLLRSWGSKLTYFVFCEEEKANAEGVSRHATCIIHNSSRPRHSCFVYCSNVKCRKGKNKKLKTFDRNAVCCHINTLLDCMPSNESSIDISLLDDSDDLDASLGLLGLLKLCHISILFAKSCILHSIACSILIL